jgi:hypothetical protein
MSTACTAYLIDPATRSLKEVAYSGDYHDIYKLCDYSTFTTVELTTDHDTAFVDDEGLIKGPVYQFFGFKGYAQPLAGKGLILGTDDEGDSIAPKHDLAFYADRLVWIERLTDREWAVHEHGKKIGHVMNLAALEAYLGTGAQAA